MHTTTEQDHELARQIHEHPFLAGLAPEHLAVLQDSAMFTEFAAGQQIFCEGDLANRFYLILEGKVQLGAHLKEGPEVCIETIGPGSVLGWSWLFRPHYWQLDAFAVTHTRALFFYGTRLREQCEAHHDLGYELMKRMAGVMLHRLQMTRKKLLAAVAAHPL